MELLIKASIISLFCIGLRIASDKGMILFFLRTPFEWSKGRSKILTYVLKPIIGCVTCMASIYTILIEYVYYDLSKWTILTIFIVAAMNSIIHAAYTKLMS